MEIVLDNSSAVFLAKLGLFALMEHPFITTSEIENEIEEGVRRGYRDALIRKELIAIKKITIINPQDTTAVSQKYKLKVPDSSLIALAKERACLLATEDEQVRKIAKLESIVVTNAGALLYHAYTKGKIDKKNTLHFIELLEQSGYNKEAALKIKEKILLEEDHG